MKIRVVGIIFLIAVALVTGCGNGKDMLLDPEKPITVTVWHYYNGNTKESFDKLVSEFNETVGMEKGIVVDAQSQGDVSQLATAVFDAANESIGASPMPDIFASYPDNAFRVNQIVPLISLDQYFDEDELAAFRKEFLEEGRFITDDKYYIVPIAKSSENLYINKTQWEAFASANGFTEEDLATWEGIYEVSKVYHEVTGKSFFSIDANANYMMVASMQLGSEMFSYTEDGRAKFELTEEIAKKIWDYYYIPYIRQYFLKTGRFSSDDAKTGSILAYTGSTAGAAYFPTIIETEESGETQIEPLILPYPHFKDGKAISIQQGAGMCITKSDDAHQYAAALFLKWFTESEQNIEFSVSTGYFPVKKEALNEELILGQVTEEGITTKSIIESIKASSIMFHSYTLYNSKPFLYSYEMRDLLERHLYDKIVNDLDLINQTLKNEDDKEALINELTSEHAFDAWYQDLNQQAQQILNQK